MSDKVLMSNGVALWLARNSNLSIDQIAIFCKMHPLQVQNLRKGSTLEGATECNPLDVSLLTLDEIERCEKDASLQLVGIAVEQKLRGNAKKSGLLEGIMWLIKKYPNLEISIISKLLGCSSTVIKSVKMGTYKHLEEVIPKNPVSLGFCSQQQLDECLLKKLK